MSTAHIVVDLGYGDSGKGSIVDHLVRTTGARLIVRYSGGPQCGHNVVTESGIEHCFSQFGSGALAGAKTYYGRFTLFEPFALFNEASVLAPKIGKDPRKDFYVEEGAVIITPYHWRTNKLRSPRGTTCGMGIGECRADQLDNQPTLTAWDLLDWNWQRVYERLLAIRDLKAAQLLNAGLDDSGSLMDESLFDLCYFYERVAKKIHIVPNGYLKSMLDGPCVFEGNQGVLLDEVHGFQPYTTWTDCTFINALRMLEGISIPVRKLGVLRTYATRHGAGPFVTESANVNFPDHNITNEWQGCFRQGYFDLVAARYALKWVGQIDGLALTHLDRFETIPMVDAYLMNGLMDRIGIPNTKDLLSAKPESIQEIHYSQLERLLDTPIAIESRGPAAIHKKELIPA